VLIVAMFALFAVGILAVDLLYESTPAGDTIPDDVVDRPGVALPMLAGFASGIAAFITGAVAILRRSERAPLVFVSTGIGALLLLFLTAEVLFPH
jgi:nitrate reductase gamma subunit